MGEEEEPGWEVDPDDDWGVAVITTVGRQLRLRREAVGLRAAEFGRVVGYGEDMVYKVESGRRIPRPEFLDKADEVLSAGGLLAAMKEDVAKVRYPKRVRELAQLEAKAVELQLYDPLNVHGLLQTPESRGRCWRCGGPRTPRTWWSEVSPRGWRESPCSSGIPHRRSASSRTNGHSCGLSGAGRCCVGSSSTC